MWNAVGKALFWAILAHAGSVSATEQPGCILWVDHLSPIGQQATEQFSALGYTVKDLDNTSAQNVIDLAGLLNTHTFYARAVGDYLALSMTSVNEKGPKWLPLVYHIRAIDLLKNDGRYSCSNMQRNLSMYGVARAALLQAWDRLSKPSQKSDFSYGHFFLQMEQDLLVRTGATVAPIEEAFARYDQLLLDFQKVTDGSDNLFANWTKVQRLIYAEDQRHITYCRGLTLMHDALFNGCTNCIGFTALFISLFEDAHLPVPDGWQLGFQNFSDHVRPVLVSLKANRSFDLTDSGGGALRDPTYKASDLLLLILKGSGKFLHASEVSVFRAVGLQPINETGWTCIPGLDLGSWLRNQLFDFSWLLRCRAFSSSQPPEKADLAYLANSSGEDGDGDSSSFGGFFHGIFSGLLKDAKGYFGLDEGQLKMLETLTADLLPNEKKAYMDGVRASEPSSEFFSSFAAVGVLSRIGVFKKDLSQTEVSSLFDAGHMEHRYLRPFLVRKEIDETVGSSQTTENEQIVSTMNSPPGACGSLQFAFHLGYLYSVASKNPGFYENMLQLRLRDRYVMILNEIALDVKKYKNLEKQSPPFKMSDFWKSDAIQFETNKLQCAQSIENEIDAFMQINTIFGFSEWFDLIGKHFFTADTFSELRQEIHGLDGEMDNSRHDLLLHLNDIRVDALEKITKMLVLMQFVIDDYSQQNWFAFDRDHPFDHFLSDILSDPDYFYTVRPTADEQAALASRPYFPQLKEQVKKLQTKTDLPNVHPPTWPGLKCSPGATFMELGSIAVDCRDLNGDKTKVGDDKGSSEDRKLGVAKGSGIDAVDMPSSSSGNLALPPSANSSAQTTNPPDLPAAFEYRQEVDLEPAVWALLFSAASWDFLLLGRTKLLIHYLWRDRLDHELQVSNDGIRGGLPMASWTVYPEERMAAAVRFSEPLSRFSNATLKADLQTRMQAFKSQRAPVTAPAYVQSGPPFMRLAFQKLMKNERRWLTFSDEPLVSNDGTYTRGDTWYQRMDCHVFAAYSPGSSLDLSVFPTAEAGSAKDASADCLWRTSRLFNWQVLDPNAQK